jgi:hypothetical protein
VGGPNHNLTHVTSVEPTDSPMYCHFECETQHISVWGSSLGPLLYHSHSRGTVTDYISMKQILNRYEVDGGVP